MKLLYLQGGYIDLTIDAFGPCILVLAETDGQRQCHSPSIVTLVGGIGLCYEVDVARGS